MATDSFIQVAPDSSGKQIDMSQVSTAAGALIYRQRAEIVGDVADAISQLLAINQQQLSALQAILAVLNLTSNSPITDEDFSPN